MGNKGKSKKNLNQHRGVRAAVAKQKNPSLAENSKPGSINPTDMAAEDVPLAKLKGQPLEPKSVAAVSLPERGCVDSPTCSRTLGESDTWSISTPHLESPQSTAADLKKPTLLQNHSTAGGKSRRPNPGVGEPSQRIKLQKIDFEDECYVVNPDDLDDISTSLGHVLLGFAAGKFPGRKAIRDTCNEWGVKYQLHFQINEWIVVRFQSKEDRERVLHNGPYKVFRTLLVLRPLPRLFNFKKREAHKAPVWVRLPGLPYDLWNEKGLSNIASRLGFPLHSDASTCAKSKLSFARILVEVDVLKDLRNSVQVGVLEGEEFEQAVIYESVPKYCSVCSSIGHGNDSCPSLNPAGKTPKPGAPRKFNSAKRKAAGNVARTPANSVGNEGLQAAVGKKKGVHTRFEEDSSGLVVAVPANLDPMKDFPPLGSSLKHISQPERKGSSSSLSGSDSCKTSPNPNSSLGQDATSKAETLERNADSSMDRNSASSTSIPSADGSVRRKKMTQEASSSQEQETGAAQVEKSAACPSSGKLSAEEFNQLKNRYEVLSKEYEKACENPKISHRRRNQIYNECIGILKKIGFERPRSKGGQQ